MPLSELPFYVRLVRDPVAFAAHHGAATRSRITNDSEAAAFFTPMLVDEEVEVMWAVALDAKSRPIKAYLVSRGTVDGTFVHAREVFRCAVHLGAARIVLAHNHPSGDTTPSAEDRAITRTLFDAGELLGIPVVDHLIVGSVDSYFSFAAEGIGWG